MKWLIACLGAAWLVAAPAFAQHGGHGAPKPDCPDGALACAAAATPAFGPDGRLWLAWSAGGRVWVAHSSDKGAHLSPQVAVTPETATIDDNGEARPLILPLADGSLLASWIVRRDAFYNGTLMVARSTDGGWSFSPPRPLEPEAHPTSRRFQTMAQAPDGRLYALWLDKRNTRAPDYPGAGLALAMSDDGGESFTSSRILVDNTCECCRIGLTFDPAGLPVLAWRNIFGANIRDHAMMRLDRDGNAGPVERVSEDMWAIDACPHHGPAAAVDSTGAWHVAWYSGGGKRRGLFRARSDDGGRHFTDPVAIGDPRWAPAHPRLVAIGRAVTLAWEEFDGETTRVMGMDSADSGLTWSASRVLAATAGASDQPWLVSDGHAPYLSWLTQAEGWRLVPAGPGSGS